MEMRRVGESTHMTGITRSASGTRPDSASRTSVLAKPYSQKQQLTRSGPEKLRKKPLQPQRKPTPPKKRPMLRNRSRTPQTLRTTPPIEPLIRAPRTPRPTAILEKLLMVSKGKPNLRRSPTDRLVILTESKGRPERLRMPIRGMLCMLMETGW